MASVAQLNSYQCDQCGTTNIVSASDEEEEILAEATEDEPTDEPDDLDEAA
jgi:hypothetical protein